MEFAGRGVRRAVGVSVDVGGAEESAVAGVGRVSDCCFALDAGEEDCVHCCLIAGAQTAVTRPNPLLDLGPISTQIVLIGPRSTCGNYPSSSGDDLPDAR